MQLIYRCDPENQERLNCVHLEVMHRGNECCFYRTKNGYCARLTDRQMKEIVDKLGQLEEVSKYGRQNYQMCKL